jgi:HemY protein
MIRILVFILVIVAGALGLAWFADQPGSITVQWLGYEIKTSAFVGALMLIGIAAVLILAWALLRFILTRPAAMSAYFQERRRSQGFEALTRGLLAVGVGDRAQAQRYTGMARRNLPNEPLTALLKAQAAQLKGDRATARRAFEGMLDRPETELLGLRGLYLEAKRSDDTNAARVIAEQVVKRDPELAWSVNALFDMQARAGDWEGALNTLAIARQHGNVEADVALRRRAALLTAEARDLEASAPAKALALANEALRLAPSLVPAAEIAGRLLASKGDSRQASRLIARTWKLAPHPDLALVYAFANPGDSPRERLKRVKHLASLTSGDIEGQIAIAMAAIEARDWREAEAALSPYLQDRPPARVCTLMARIEAGEGNKGREREWLARAVRAPRDRAWIADGYISDRWLPVSPVTGAVDAFEWKAPVDAIGKGDDTLLIEEGLETPEPAPAPPPLVVSPPAQIEDQAPRPDEPPAKSPESSGDGASSPRVPVVEIKPTEPTQEAAAPKPQRQDLGAPPRREPELYVPPRPPDDPGIGPADPDESPASLERLRTAQIR